MFSTVGGSCRIDVEIETVLEAEGAANIPHPISWDQVRDEVAKDKVKFMLAHQITEGFPPEKKLLSKPNVTQLNSTQPKATVKATLLG